MNNQVMPFDFKGNQVRTVMIDNVPYFLGNDVAKLLGYKRIGDALKNHIEPYERKTLTYKGFGDLAKPLWNKNDYANKTLIKESGMISLVFGSNLPQAKEFKRWATEEVLPEVMRTGSYQSNKTKQLSAIEQLKLATQSVGELDDRVTNLEDNQYLNPGEYAYLGRLISKKVYEYLSINNYELSKKQIGKLFKDINSGIKQITNISTRSQLRNKDFDKVEKYVREWIPTKATLVIIEEMKEKVKQ